MTSTSAVIVTYGDRQRFFERSIVSAFACGASQVFLVLNGASTQALVRARQLTVVYSHLTLIECNENLGSAGGFKRGMEAALATDGSFVWLLDDDNEAHSDCLSNLLAAYDDELGGRTAVLGFRRARPTQVAALERGLTSEYYAPRGGFLYFDLVSRLRSCKPFARTMNSEKTTVYLPYAPYGGLLLANSFIQEVGLPNEAMKLYEDDTEFSLRLVEAGISIRLCGEAIIEDMQENFLEGNARGPIRLLRSDQETKVLLFVRNRTYVDSRRARGRSLRLGLNAAMFFGFLLLSCRSRSDIDRVLLMARSAKEGLKGDFSTERSL